MENPVNFLLTSGLEFNELKKVGIPFGINLPVGMSEGRPTIVREKLKPISLVRRNGFFILY